MKKWFVLSLALVAAAVSHAVTVSWVVSNSSYNTNSWAYTAQDGVFKKLNINIYFVYSATEISSLEKVRDFASNGKGTWTIDQTVATVEYGNVMEDPDPEYAGGMRGEVRAYANNLPPSPDGNNLVNGEGYYYMVVTNEAGQYAVAGTTTKVVFDDGKDFVNGEDAGRNGIYANNVGLEPKPEEYVDMGWLGGTLGDAFVPEPTVLALLAMGVAGVALRRKQNFLK